MAIRLLPLLLISSSSSILASAIFTTHADSGLEIEYTKPLTCTRRTQAGDGILVDYRGTLQSNGQQFDSSFDRHVPFSFHIGKGEVIKGWDEGLLQMCVGEQRKLIIPPELGYGNRNVGPIPAGSTLVFETTLVGVIGVSKEETEGYDPELDEAVNDETDDENSGVGEEVGFPASDNFMPPVETEDDAGKEPAPADNAATPGEHNEEEDSHQQQEDAPVEEEEATSSPLDSIFTIQKNECRLLGPFALVVQGALGLLALLSLVFKRWRERPRRPLKVWIFDVSKQVVGTFLIHLANLAMSEFSSGSFDVLHHASQELAANSVKDGHGGRQPNPCSFYLLNLAIDTTIGIPVLVILLSVLQSLFSHTALANPPESIKSGHYGVPPRATWWAKQCIIYFLGLLGMKLFVLFLFAALPWLGWVGDWALRWTEGSETLQIAFVMFVFPVLMNGVQYYVIDGFIKEKADSSREGGFERVAQQEDGSDGQGSEEGDARVGYEDEIDDEEETLVAEEREDSKKGGSSRVSSREDVER